jgi:hypothetical protein
MKEIKTDILTELNDQKRKVDFNTYDISVKEIISMVGDGIIDIAPDIKDSLGGIQTDNQN